MAQPQVSLVIVDEKNALGQESRLAQVYLRWFRSRAPVLLLSDSGCSALEGQYDYCLPKTTEKQKVLSCIQALGFRTKP